MFSDTIRTEDSYNYDVSWIKLSREHKTLKVSVKASNDAHICLSPTPNHDAESYEG